MKQITLLILLALLFAAAPVQGALIYFNNDKPGWVTAVGGVYLTEDFNDDILNPGLSYISDGGTVAPPVFRDYVSRGEGTTIWSFEQPVKAVGANWDLSPYSYGTGLQVVVCYDDFSCDAIPFELPNNATGEFIGFVSDKPILQIIYTGGTQPYDGAPGTDINAESLEVDNLTYAFFSSGGQDPTPDGQIPEPSTWLLSGTALAALAWHSRQRK